MRVADWMAQYGVTWFEEPVSSQDLAGLAAVRRQVLPDVTAGEYSWSLADSARLIDAGAVDCLQLDVTRCGGITEFLRSCALAAAHNLQVSGHCAPSLHALRRCRRAQTSGHVEYFHDHQRIERLLFDGALDPDGGVRPPTPASQRSGPEPSERPTPTTTESDDEPLRDATEPDASRNRLYSPVCSASWPIALAGILPSRSAASA